ncbi:MAG TPA: SIMPL domain-containing protein, partial [bacterium]|nr:SIMPL domain-containing protein [bacterium]
NNNYLKIIFALILGCALIIASYILGDFLYKSRQEKTITATGFASLSAASDIVKWRLTISREAKTTNLKEGYLQIAKDLEKLKDILIKSGIADTEINIQPINANPVYSNYGKIENYSLQQSIFIVSKNLELIEKSALNPENIMNQNILIQYSNLEYYFENIGDLKISLIKQATGDGLKRAEEIAASAGSKIDKLISARVGVFQITEPYSNEITDYGVYNISSKAKEVKVTVKVTVSLK